LSGIHRAGAFQMKPKLGFLLVGVIAGIDVSEINNVFCKPSPRAIKALDILIIWKPVLPEPPLPPLLPPYCRSCAGHRIAIEKDAVIQPNLAASEPNPSSPASGVDDVARRRAGIAGRRIAGQTRISSSPAGLMMPVLEPPADELLLPADPPPHRRTGRVFHAMSRSGAI